MRISWRESRPATEAVLRKCRISLDLQRFFTLLSWVKFVASPYFSSKNEREMRIRAQNARRIGRDFAGNRKGARKREILSAADFAGQAQRGRDAVTAYIRLPNWHGLLPTTVLLQIMCQCSLFSSPTTAPARTVEKARRIAQNSPQGGELTGKLSRFSGVAIQYICSISQHSKKYRRAGKRV
jgi:hypothetical protein